MLLQQIHSPVAGKFQGFDNPATDCKLIMQPPFNGSTVGFNTLAIYLRRQENPLTNERSVKILTLRYSPGIRPTHLPVKSQPIVTEVEWDTTTNISDSFCDTERLRIEHICTSLWATSVTRKNSLVQYKVPTTGTVHCTYHRNSTLCLPLVQHTMLTTGKIHHAHHWHNAPTTGTLHYAYHWYITLCLLLVQYNTLPLVHYTMLTTGTVQCTYHWYITPCLLLVHYNVLTTGTSYCEYHKYNICHLYIENMWTLAAYAL